MVAKVMFGHPNWRQTLYSGYFLSSDTLSLFATTHLCVGIDRSELSTYLLQKVNGNSVTTDCSPAVYSPDGLVLGNAANQK